MDSAEQSAQGAAGQAGGGRPALNGVPVVLGTLQPGILVRIMNYGKSRERQAPLSRKNHKSKPHVSLFALEYCTAWRY